MHHQQTQKEQRDFNSLKVSLKPSHSVIDVLDPSGILILQSNMGESKNVAVIKRPLSLLLV